MKITHRISLAVTKPMTMKHLQPKSGSLQIPQRPGSRRQNRSRRHGKGLRSMDQRPLSRAEDESLREPILSLSSCNRKLRSVKPARQSSTRPLRGANWVPRYMENHPHWLLHRISSSCTVGDQGHPGNPQAAPSTTHLRSPFNRTSHISQAKMMRP